MWNESKGASAAGAADSSGVFAGFSDEWQKSGRRALYIKGSAFCARPRNLLGARGVNGALASNVMSHCGSPARIWKYLCWSQSGNYKVWGIYGTANNNQTGVVSGMVWCTVYLHSTCLSFAVHGKSNVRSISVLAQPSIYRLFVCLLICWHLFHYCYINNSFTLWMSLE